MINDKILSAAVFDRIKALYNLPSDAAMARKLDVFPQDIPRFRNSGSLPYKQILNTCPPQDWAHIFLGESPKASTSVEDAIHTLKAAGFTVTLG